MEKGYCYYGEGCHFIHPGERTQYKLSNRNYPNYDNQYKNNNKEYCLNYNINNNQYNKMTNNDNYQKKSNDDKHNNKKKKIINLTANDYCLNDEEFMKRPNLLYNQLHRKLKDVHLDQNIKNIPLNIGQRYKDDKEKFRML